MDLFLVITTLTVIAASILFDWWYFMKLRSKKLPPGPSPWPIVGTIPQVAKHGGGVTKLSQTLQGKYGKIHTLWLGRRPMIFVNDPELTHDALVKQGIYFSNRVKLSSFGLVTNGWKTLATTEGSMTVALRKNIMTHMLGPSRLKAFKPLRDRAYDAIISDVKSAVGEDGVAQVHMRSVVYERIFTFVLALSFGVELEENITKEIILVLKERFYLAFKFSIGDYISVLKLFEGKHRNRLKQHQQRLEELFAPIMERLRRLQGDKSVITGNYCETLFQLEKDFPELNDSVITSLCSEFLNSATHTTSLAVDNTMSQLCEHPQVQGRLYQEIESVVGKKVVDESDLPHLPYLSAVVRESLRIKSPAATSLAHATSELRKLGGYDIPTDAVVLFGLESFHHDPSRWLEPSVFNPERFLENDLDILGTQNFSFLPFSAGRRACPGSQLAMLEISVFVARMVQTFEWEKAPDAKSVQASVGTALRARPRSV
ncbi:hypothetical protein R1flu_006706 [Riccia fluitans]|uniref:Cytochrome P450 n=1 Tax=Riccia fluitans TaxID=41844 RepID=A0ABD1Z0V3_9MARC